MELSSERSFYISVKPMDFVVTVMYEQALVQGKCIGGTPDAALIHQYVKHRNHVCRLRIKVHAAQSVWVICTDDLQLSTTKKLHGPPVNPVSLLLGGPSLRLSLLSGFRRRLSQKGLHSLHFLAAVPARLGCPIHCSRPFSVLLATATKSPSSKTDVARGGPS